MATRKTKEIQEPKRDLILTEEEIEITRLCVSMTHLKLEMSCPMDRQYAKTWYGSHYLSGKHVRYVMKKGLSINHVCDGIVYRAFNTTDAIAERLMRENKDYVGYFDDLGEYNPFEIDKPTTQPETGGGEPVEPVDQVESEKPVEPVDQVESEKPVEPVDQVESEKPVEPVDPVEPEKPTDTEPVDPLML